MSREPFFSICIPCFNHAPYVGKTIASVLAQDFDDFEIIVADNASTDGSREVVRAFSDPRLRLIENRYNIGFAPNLQQVTRQARGRFVNLLSSDDIMNPGALRTYAELIESHPVDAERLVLMSQAFEIDGQDRQTRYIARAAERFAPVRAALPDAAEIERQPHHEIFDGFDVFTACMKTLDTAGTFCTVVYSRQLWEAVEGYNSTQLFNPDIHFIVKVLRQNPKVIYVNRPLYSYRRHAGGNAAEQARNQTLKLQIDQYLYLTNYNDAWLAGTGVTTAAQRRLFIERDCIHYALAALANGQRLAASRLLAFAWATFPAIAAARLKFWALAGLLTVGPLGPPLARFARARLGMRKELPRLDELMNAARDH